MRQIVNITVALVNVVHSLYNRLFKKENTMDTTTSPITLTALQRNILNKFNQKPFSGLTSQEVIAYFPNVSDSSIRTRISELVKLGYLRKSVGTRVSKNGRRMAVLVIV